MISLSFPPHQEGLPPSVGRWRLEGCWFAPNHSTSFSECSCSMLVTAAQCCSMLLICADLSTECWEQITLRYWFRFLTRQLIRCIGGGILNSSEYCCAEENTEHCWCICTGPALVVPNKTSGTCWPGGWCTSHQYWFQTSSDYAVWCYSWLKRRLGCTSSEKKTFAPRYSRRVPLTGRWIH